MRKLFFLMLLIASITTLAANAILGNISSDTQNPLNQEKSNFNSEVKFGERPFIDIYKVPDSSIEQGHIRIKLDASYSDFVDRLQNKNGIINGFGISQLDELNQQFGITEIAKLFYFPSGTNKHEWRHKLWGLNLWYELRFDAKFDVRQIVMAYRELKDVVAWAEPEYAKVLFDADNITAASLSDAMRWSSNDPQLSSQWHYNNTGQTGGTVDADIDLFEAWDIEKGNSNVVVAVIDQGIQTNHPDLAANMWINSDEIAGDGIDNDGNGYIDDIYGYNFYSSSSTISAGDHGCHTSGTIAAVTNNSIGVAGIAGGSGTGNGVRLMSCQVFSSSGSGSGFDVSPIYAADNGAAISQNSWGYTSAGSYEQSVLDAIDYFNANGGGTVLNGGITIYAAGNSSSTGQWYPGCYSGSFAVAATDQNDVLAWYSNFDTWVDVSAPGGDTSINNQGVLSTISNNSYGYMQGTSMACPHTSGTAALIISYAYRNGTVLANSDIANILRTTTDNIYGVNPSHTGQMGTGRINAYSALLAVTPGLPSCTITAPANNATFDLNSTITVNVTATDSDGTITSVAFYIDSSPTPSYTDYSAPYTWNWNTNGVSGGAHTIKAVATDNSSNTAQRTVSITLLAPASEGFETGNFSLYPWAQSGNLPWVVQSSDVFSGTYAAKSGTILDSQSSSLDLTLNITSAGNITFYQKVSSEANYDYLRFYIDSVEQGAWSGAGTWTLQSYPVTTGPHNFKWTYAKDGLYVGGTDAGYLDHIVFPPHNVPTPPTITWNPTAFTQTMPGNQTVNQTLTLGNTGTSSLTFTASLPSGILTVLDETFATTIIPTNWTQSPVSGTTLNWISAIGGTDGTSNMMPSTAYDGTYNARLFKNSSTASVVKLITPSLDLSGSASATLTFWHTQTVWSGDQDELRVYYRTSSGGAWTNLATYTASIATWTMETITLPNINGTYYIAFEGTAKWGYGVCVDKVVITKTGGGSTPWVTLNGGTSVSNTIAGGGNQNITVGLNTTGMSDGIYNSTITVTSNSTTNSTVTIPVTLTVLSASPQIAVNPTSLSYGTVMINTTTSQNFNIANAGTAVLTGSITTPTGYTVALVARQTVKPEENTLWTASGNTPERNTLAFSVPAGGSNNYSVTFAPIAVQAYNGNVTITHTAGGGDRTVTLTGAGGKPVIGLSAMTFTTNQAPGMTNNQTLTVSNTGNMTLNYALSITGSPAWLTVNGASTYNSNIISGGPAQNVTIGFNTAGMAPATYNATIVCASNDPSALSQNITVTLTVRNPLAITAPAVGASWPGGSLRNIVFGYSGAGTSVNMYYSFDDGAVWIAGGSLNVALGSNTYGWIVPNFPSATCRIKIVDSIAPNVEKISNLFSIVAPALPLLTVTAPNGGESWDLNSVHNITWTHNLLHPQVMLYYSLDNGSGWTYINTVNTSALSYSWTTPNVASGLCRIKIVDADDQYAYDVSNNTFFIYPTPDSFRVISPNGGEIIEAGTVSNITWSALFPVQEIYYSVNGGANWNLIDQNPSGFTTPYAWTVPSNFSIQCLVKIRYADMVNMVILEDVSNSNFTIANPAPPTIPADVSVTYNSSTGAATIAWSASTGNPTGYNVWFSDSWDFATSTLLAYVPAPQTSYTDTLVNTRPWGFYRIAAVRN